jgi:Gram-negative bacterial TonB protein C-terminal
MRAFALSIATVICLSGMAQQAAGKASPAARYQAEITQIAHHSIEAELLKHPDRVKGASMKLRYLIGPGGQVFNVTVVTIQENSWVEKTAVKALKATKFPPVPKDIRREYFETEVDINYATESARNAASPAFDKYNLQVHKMLQDQARPVLTAQTHRLEVDYEFYLDARGRVTTLHADAKTGGRWVERAIADCIRAVKFPPVPPEVFKELEQKTPVKIYGTMSWDPKG